MKLAIIHYLSLEYYPPVTNLLDFLSLNHSKKIHDLSVFSTYNLKSRKNYSFPIEFKKYRIYRGSLPSPKNGFTSRLFKYIIFNLLSLLRLIIKQPDILLYYESYSAWPAYMYTRYFNRKCKIYIHNHEYSPKVWYKTTMKQVRYFHKLETSWLYPRAVWISQTNEDRLNFFYKDHPNLKKEILKVMPNYPPKEWVSHTTYQIPQFPKIPLRIIYIGSLSFQSTYLKEFCEWIIYQKGKIRFDIYSYNLQKDVIQYLTHLSCPFINFFNEGIEYRKQPTILANYHVGMILYKPHNINFIYNAPNKLFEYLICNLDVWYPKELEGPKPYNRSDSYPKVMSLDFTNLRNFNWEAAICHKKLQYKSYKYFCEEIYFKLVNDMYINFQKNSFQ